MPALAPTQTHVALTKRMESIYHTHATFTSFVRHRRHHSKEVRHYRRELRLPPKNGWERGIRRNDEDHKRGSLRLHETPTRRRRHPRLQKHRAWTLGKLDRVRARSIASLERYVWSFCERHMASLTKSSIGPCLRLPSRGKKYL